MKAEKITSVNNPLIKEVVNLRKAAKRRKEDLIIIEGLKEIATAAGAGIVIEKLFYCSELARTDNKPDMVMSRETIRLTPAVFAKIAYRENPDGFLALARPEYKDLARIKLGRSPLLIVLETVEKPGNLGAVMRTADAAGVDAVLVCDPKTDIYNPNVIRASLGAVFTVQTITCSSPEAIEFLKAHEIRIFAATPQGARLYTETDMRGASAFIIGTEHEGLSRDWLDAADERIKIPQLGRVDSLNASVSAAIIMFEALRQRSAKAE